MSNELPKLDWESASVHDETLTVELAGERPKHWRKSFEQTVKLLPSGEWEDVACKEGTITVTGVRAGVEDRLAHFLESVVQQVNANFASADDSEEDQPDAEASAEEGKEGQKDPDAELTARFRAFGQ